MRLQSFKIMNVKSIKDSGKCHLSAKDNVTVLAGQNEAGKSAILEALDFFRNGPNDKFMKLSTRISENPVVQCTFLIDTDDRNHDDSAMKHVLSALKEVSFYRGSETEEKKDKIYISEDSYEQIVLAVSSLPAILREMTAEGQPKEIDQQIIDRASAFFVDFIPEFIFYDSFADILPGEILISDIPNNRAVKDFENFFNVEFAQTINFTPQQLSAFKREISEKASLDLNEYWSQTQTTKDDDKYQFEVNVNIADDKSKVEFLIHRNDGNHLFLEQKSKGFQWFNAFNLRLKALGITKNENLQSYVILIDEPGQGLHEAAQRDVKKVLEEIAKDGAQVIYSTHNPSLIGINDEEILRIRLVSQTPKRGSKIRNIAQFSSQSGSKEALSPIITAMGISHAGQIIDREKKIILVEGLTDHYYLNALRTYLKIDEDCVFIPACGAQNAQILIAILFGWRQTFRAILDDGAAGRSVLRIVKKHLYIDNDDQLSREVKILLGSDGIEDLFTQADFDKYIAQETRSGSVKNSELAKQKKKELLARLFLESVRSDKVKLSKETTANFKNIFDWIKNGA